MTAERRLFFLLLFYDYSNYAISCVSLTDLTHSPPLLTGGYVSVMTDLNLIN